MDTELMEADMIANGEEKPRNFLFIDHNTKIILNIELYINCILKIIATKMDFIQ
jgi:hypothetical protein